MVRTQKKVLGSRKYRNFSNDQLIKAVEAVRSGLSLRKAEEQFGVPRCSINRAINGKNTGKVGRPFVLNENDQNALAMCLCSAGDWGFPLTLYDIRLIVKAFLDRSGRNEYRFKNNMPGPDFVMSFLKRHQNTLSNKMCQNIKRARAKVDHDAINLYFDELNHSFEGVLPHSVINYDETNITDDPGRKKVVVRRGCRHPERIIDSSKSSTSVMFAAAGDGTLLPPYVIYKAENLYNTWTEHGPKGTVYNRSKSGWFTLEIFEDWFRKIALPYFLKQDKEEKKVMIGDNLASHISPYIIEECKKNNIIFILLPPNSTGLTQPLDVAFFRPLKIKWRETLSSWKAKNRGTIPKDTFPRLLKKCLEEMGKENISKNVKSGFRGAGLIPLNREEVLKRLPGKKAVEEDKENDNTAWVSTFQEYLEECRRKETDGLRKQTKKKLNVPAGRGISEEDIVILKDNPKQEKKKRKQLMEDQSVINKEKLTSESDEDSCNNEVVLDDSSDDDWDSFRAKQIMNIEDNIDDNIEDNNQESISSHPTLQPINKQVGSFVVVRYDSNFYPGVIEKLDDKGATISAMTKTIRENWKWPEHKDELYYCWQDIVGGIKPPKALNKRGIFSIPEMKPFLLS